MNLGPDSVLSVPIPEKQLDAHRLSPLPMSPSIRRPRGSIRSLAVTRNVSEVHWIHTRIPPRIPTSTARLPTYRLACLLLLAYPLSSVSAVVKEPAMEAADEGWEVFEVDSR